MWFYRDIVGVVVEYDNSLVVSLEEFGLSQYEARAYFAMVSMGPVAATELAYNSQLPRTKVYSVLQKLKRKNLATISKSKPIICTAVPPEEAFDDIIHEQINKVNAMNTLVSALKTVGEESRRKQGTAEKHYRHITLSRAVSEIKAIIDGCKKSLKISMGIFGTEPVLECRKEIAAAMHRGVEVYLLVSSSEQGVERGVLPACTHVRIADNIPSMFMADGASVVVLDESGGDVFTTHTLGSCIGASFDVQWSTGIDARHLLDMPRYECAEVYTALRQIQSQGLLFVLEKYMASKELNMIQLLEKGGIPIHSKTINDLVEIADASLQAVCNGCAILDMAGGRIILESAPHNMVWVLVLESYLRHKGYNIRTISNSKGTHIQLEKSKN